MNKKTIFLFLFTACYLLFTIQAQAVLQPFPEDDVAPYYWQNINSEGNSFNFGQQQEGINSSTPTPTPTPTPTTPIETELIADVIPTTTATYTIDGTNNTTTPVLTQGDIVIIQTNASTPPVFGIVTTPLSSSELSIDNTPLSPGTYEISKAWDGTGNTVSFTTDSSNGTWNNITGSYTDTDLGDIVLFQAGTSAAQWGVITNANANQGTFTINDQKLSANTSYVMTKVSLLTTTSAVDNSQDGKLTQGMNFAVGDWVLGNTGSGYVWGVVTTAEIVPAGGTVTNLRLNNATTAPQFKQGTRVSKITPKNSGPGTISGNRSALYWLLIIGGILGLAGSASWAYFRFRKKSVVKV